MSIVKNMMLIIMRRNNTGQACYEEYAIDKRDHNTAYEANHTNVPDIITMHTCIHTIS